MSGGTSASAPRAGEAGAARGRCAVTAAGMEGFVWLRSSVTAGRAFRATAVEKVSLPVSSVLYCKFYFQWFVVRTVSMEENAEKMVGADVRKDSLDRNVKL